VNKSGLCKISDFGISKTDDIDMIGTYTSMEGDVFCMAPEVVNSQKDYHSKVDTWSVGCVVFEMWTGERPRNGQDFVAVLIQVCTRFNQVLGSLSLSSLAFSIGTRPSISGGSRFILSSR